MSVQSDCPACAQGNHDRHDPSHGLREGLIGGTYCGCSGDCAERAEVTAESIRAAEVLNPGLPPISATTWATEEGDEVLRDELDANGCRHWRIHRQGGVPVTAPDAEALAEVLEAHQLSHFHTFEFARTRCVCGEDFGSAHDPSHLAAHRAHIATVLTTYVTAKQAEAWDQGYRTCGLTRLSGPRIDAPNPYRIENGEGR